MIDTHLTLAMDLGLLTLHDYAFIDTVLLDIGHWICMLVALGIDNEGMPLTNC